MLRGPPSELYDPKPKLFAGFSARISPGGCEDVRCKAELARRFAADHTHTGGDELNELQVKLPTARLKELPLQRNAPLEGWREEGLGYAVPAYATVAGDRQLLVPLRLLGARARVTDLHFPHGTDFTEILELEMPPGFALEPTRVPARTASAPLVEATLEVEPTATGARVTRRLKRSIGGVPAAQFQAVHDAHALFVDARQLVLSFLMVHARGAAPSRGDQAHRPASR